MANNINHGGARPGAGRIPGKRSDAQRQRAAVRVRLESIKADRSEFAYRAELAQWVNRDAYLQAVETMIQSFAHFAANIGTRVRTINGVDDRAAAAVDTAGAEALATLADDLRSLPWDRVSLRNSP
jgi:hypothetical protein